MGMFSEVHHANQAADYQKILIAAIESDNRELISFCKEHVFPKYNDSVVESYGLEFDGKERYGDIQKFFNEK